MPSVLFVCTANQYRSPIAAALFKARLFADKRPGRWDVNSAGTWTIPGLAAAPLARKLARRYGLILEMHRTRLLSQAQLINSDLILVMEAGHKEALRAEFPSVARRVFLLSEVVDGVSYDVPDPARSPEHAREYIQELCELIERGFPQITDLAVSLSDGGLIEAGIVQRQNNTPRSEALQESVPTLRADPGSSGSQPVRTTGIRGSHSAPEDRLYPASAAGNLPAGKRHTRPARQVHGLLLFLFPAALLLLGWAGFRLWQVYQLGEKVLMDMRKITTLAGSLPEGAQPAQAGTALSALNQDLKALEDQVGPFLWIGPLLRWVPIYGGDLASAKDLLDLGNDLTLSADQTYLTFLPIMQAAAPNAAGSSPDPAHLIEMLDQAQPGLASTRATFDRAKLARQRIHLERLSPKLRRLISKEVDPAMAWLDDGLSLAASLPSISGMGAAGPRTYLLLVQNEDELRPSGGFITAVGTLVVQDGKITSLTFEDSGRMEDWSKPYPLAPWQLEQYMDSPVLVFRDSNWFVDFPTSAEYAKYLYRLAQPGRVRIDGVIAFNQNVLVSLLEVLGPIQVDGVPYPISATNVEDYMRNAKTPPPPGQPQSDWDRKAFISKIARAVLNELLSPGNANWNKLSAVVLRLLDERQILLQTNDADASQVLARRGWDGAVQPGEADFLYVVDSNIGFNKTNAVVTEQLSYDVDLSDPAHPTGKLTVIERNDASADVPCIQWDEGQITSEEWYPIDRCYWDYLRVYQSSRSTLVDSTPHAAPHDWMILEQDVPPRVDVLDDGISGVQGYGTLVVVPGGGSVATTFEFALSPGVLVSVPDSDQRIYRLKIQKQAGTLAVPVTVRIHFPSHISLLSVPEGALVQGSNIMLQADLDTDLLVEVAARLR